MPLYDAKCGVCDHEFETVAKIDELIQCPVCGSEARRLITGSSYHPFPEGWWEDIGPKPIYISSRRQLADECRKHGCYAKYLDPDIPNPRK